MPIRTTETKAQPQGVLSFPEFWRWLKGHAGCIVSVATPDAALYDNEELHWQLGEEDGSAVIQLLHGKTLVGEIVVAHQYIDYVQVDPDGEEEFVFDCIASTDGDCVSAYSFTLAHAYVPDVRPTPSRLVH